LPERYWWDSDCCLGGLGSAQRHCRNHTTRCQRPRQTSAQSQEQVCEQRSSENLPYVRSGPRTDACRGCSNHSVVAGGAAIGTEVAGARSRCNRIRYQYQHRIHNDIITIDRPHPLPAALPLFASGVGVLGLFSRRKNRKNAAAIAAA
jgi:hypothetical protein